MISARIFQMTEWCSALEMGHDEEFLPYYDEGSKGDVILIQYFFFFYCQVINFSYIKVLFFKTYYHLQVFE